MANTVFLMNPSGAPIKVALDSDKVQLAIGDSVLLLVAYRPKDRVNWADALHSAAKMFEDLVVKDTLKDAVKPSPKVIIDVEAFKAGKTYTVDGVTFAYSEDEVKS